MVSYAQVRGLNLMPGPLVNDQFCVGEKMAKFCK